MFYQLNINKYAICTSFLLTHRKLHLYPSHIQTEASAGLLHVPHLHSYVPHRDHVLDFVLDQTRGSSSKSDPLCDVTAYAVYAARPVSKVFASRFLHKSHRHIHVFLYSVRVCLPHGICHGQHPSRRRGRKRE